MSFAKVFSEVNALVTERLIESYALGGAVAAINYLEPAATEDVDIFVAFRSDLGSPLAPLEPIYAFLVSRGARVEAGHLVIGTWPVQLLPSTGPLLAEAMREARVTSVDGEAVRVFSAEHLAAIALDTGRVKDKVRLAAFLEWDGFDRPKFESIVRRHSGLLAKWDAFRQGFLK